LYQEARVATEEFGHPKRVVGPAPYGKEPIGTTPTSSASTAGREYEPCPYGYAQAEKIVVAERHVTAAVISYCTLPPLAA
jgi:hypothetical protein